MKRIKEFDELIAKGGPDFAHSIINATFYFAYRDAIECGNETINFDEVIWTREIPIIAKALRESGMDEFTISSQCTDLIKTLAAFETEGCKIIGLTMVNASYADIQTGTNAIVPAIRLKTV